MKAGLLILTILLIIGCRQKDRNLITTYGAIADGKTNNAVSIQYAIDQVSADGGGQVIVPPGNFMTCTIFLKSGVDLHLEAGACLMGPSNRNDYTDCKRVRITNCFINSADDGICLKSSNPDSSCEDIYIDSCTVRSSASALKLGTASAGGFKNIKVRNLMVLQIKS